MVDPVNLSKITVEKLKELSPEVRDLKISVGHDSTGDPAVFLTVILSDKVSDKAILERKFRDMEKWIFQTLWDEGGNQFWPYITLRRVREEREERESVGVR